MSKIGAPKPNSAKKMRVATYSDTVSRISARSSWRPRVSVLDRFNSDEIIGIDPVRLRRRPVALGGKAS